MKTLAAVSILIFCSVALLAQQHIRVNDGATGVRQEAPTLAIDANGNMTSAWIDYRTGSAQVFLARSTTGGRTWTPAVRVSGANAKPTGGWELGPYVTQLPSGEMSVIWTDMRRPPDWAHIDVCAARSTDNGRTFGADPRLNNDVMAAQQQPAMTSDARNIYVAWHGFPASGQNPATPIWAVRSTDGGATFSQQVRVDTYAPAQTDTIASCNCCGLGMFTNGSGNIYLPFRIDSANLRDIFLSRSTDYGVTWQQAVPVSHGRWFLNVCPGSGPRGVARGDTVWVAYMDQRSGYQAVYLTRSVDGGRTFGQDVKLADSSNFPDVTVDSRGRVISAWSTVPRLNIAHVYCAASEDGGLTFNKPVRVNPNAAVVNGQVTLAAAPNGNVYCTWRETPTGDEGDMMFSNATELLYPPAGVDERGPRSPLMLSIAPQPLLAGQSATVYCDASVTSLRIVDLLGRTVLTLDGQRAEQPFALTAPGTYFMIAHNGAAHDVRPIVVR